MRTPRVPAYRPLPASAQYNMAHKKARDGEDVSEIADHLWRFLDKLHSENPTEYKKFIDEQMEEGRKILTPPEPVYCLLCQARAWGNNCSLYINVCKWSRVPKPQTGQDPIPVKGGVLRYLLDERTKLKTASKDLVFDAAFHPSVMEECSRDPMLDKMMVSLLLEYAEKFADLIVLNKEAYKKIEDQFKGPKADLQHSLDERWGHLLTAESRLDMRRSLLKQLNNPKTDQSESKGDLPPLIFRTNGTTSPSGSSGSTQPRRRLIEEITPAKQKASSATTKSQETERDRPTASTGEEESRTCSSGKSERLCIPEHSVTVKEPDSKHPARRVLVKTILPGVSSANQVDLEVSKTDLQLSVKEQYHLSLVLPTAVDEDATRAKFTSKNSTLTITMPVL